MTGEAFDRQDQLLRRIVVGELDPEAQEVRALAAEDAGFRAALGELDHIRRELERTGSGARSDMVAAREGGDAPGEDRVAGLVRELVDARREPPRANRLGLWLAFAAAVLALASVAAWRLGREPAPPAPPLLLGTSFQDLQPDGEVKDFVTFSWSFELNPGGWFDVVVYGWESGAVVGRADGVTRSEWRPESTTDWPQEVRWEVYAYDGSGKPQGSAEARARRSSR